MENQTNQPKSKIKFPTENVELPSKGLLYPKDSPLHSGKIEVKYMSAREEDILTNSNYLKQGIAIDKLLESVIITPIKLEDLLMGDKNAILIATRILGYGSNYPFTYEGEEINIDLSTLPINYLDESKLKEPGTNAFDFTLPHSENVITFKLLTGKDEKSIQNEIKGLKKINKNFSPELSTRLKHQIIAVNGETEIPVIRDFIDNNLLARDARAFREYLKQINPDVKMTFIHQSTNGEVEVTIPMEVQFLWPDARV